MHTDDSPARRAEILHAAYRTLRPLLLTEPAFHASVSGITRRTIRFTRARFVIEERAIERRFAAAPGTERAAIEPLITPVLDPWGVDGEELASATRQLCSCSRCQGAEARKAEVACPCCAGATRVYTWLEVACRKRVAVSATPAAVATHWLPSALDEADFLNAEFAHQLEHETLLPGEHADELPGELLPKLDENDRIVQVCAQSFMVEAHDVRYQTAFGTGLLEMAGTPLTVFDVVRTPLIRRSVAARSAALIGAVASVAVALSYREQHPWFAKYGPNGTALLIGLLASLLLGASLLGWLRARASRTALSTWCPTAGALALTATCTALLTSAQPSVADARDALQKHDLERAALTADALSALGRSVSDHQTLRDDIRLARMAGTQNLERKIKLATSGPWSVSRTYAMRSAVLQAMEPIAAQARAANDGAALVELSSVIAPVLPAAAHALAVEAAALGNRVCLAKADIACIERSANELGRLGAGELASRSRRALVTILEARFERALAAVAHSRTVRFELAHMMEASSLAQKLAAAGAPIKRSMQVTLERGVARAERQLALAASTSR